ncbi:hypothetical protein NL676_027816 [Syzygium grande]|nr:hypothetical protein NL676_027816 [Syzygium grande]
MHQILRLCGCHARLTQSDSGGDPGEILKTDRIICQFIPPLPPSPAAIKPCVSAKSPHFSRRPNTFEKREEEKQPNFTQTESSTPFETQRTQKTILHQTTLEAFEISAMLDDLELRRDVELEAGDLEGSSSAAACRDDC